ncbi:MAG: GatB/YqeY domain-containing protein [Candidatus Omnitrophota bacterium]
MVLEKIDADLKEAMKQKDELKVSTLRFLKSAVNYVCIEKKKEKLEDGEIFEILNKQIKMRLDAIEGFKKGLRDDLVKKEEAEMEILKHYLPPPLSEEELNKMIREEIDALGTLDKSSFGKAMKSVLSRAVGRADASRVSAMVKEALSK